VRACGGVGTGECVADTAMYQQLRFPAGRCDSPTIVSRRSRVIRLKMTKKRGEKKQCPAPYVLHESAPRFPSSTATYQQARDTRRSSGTTAAG